MARPSNANPSGTRRRILDAAVTAFAEAGFDGASTRRIASIADVNIATIHYHFQSKQRLYEEAVGEVYRRILGGVDGIVRKQGPVTPEEIVSRAYDAVRAERAGMRLLLREVVESGRLSVHTEREIYFPMLDRLSAAVASGLARPLRKVRAGLVAAAVLLNRYAVHDEDFLIGAFGVDGPADVRELVVFSVVATLEAHFGAMPRTIDAALVDAVRQAIAIAGVSRERG